MHLSFFKVVDVCEHFAKECSYNPDTVICFQVISFLTLFIISFTLEVILIGFVEKKIGLVQVLVILCNFLSI